jgi:CubicO group peptidase (beta-lactamase class C family)
VEPYVPNLRHKLYLLSKSFTSIAIVIAIDGGLLTLDTIIADIFIDEVDGLGNRVPERIRRMAIRHLLMMNTGQNIENWQSDNIEGFLAAPVEFEPGTTFFIRHTIIYLNINYPLFTVAFCRKLCYNPAL